MNIYWTRDCIKGNNYIIAECLSHAIRIHVHKIGHEPNEVKQICSEALSQKELDKEKERT